MFANTVERLLVFFYILMLQNIIEHGHLRWLDIVMITNTLKWQTPN